MDKPNCYKCEYRGTLPGDAHSQCKYPDVFRRPGYMTRMLRIKGEQHGIDNGWFIWPFNFDPTWLKNCDGFKPKEGEGKCSTFQINTECETTQF